MAFNANYRDKGLFGVYAVAKLDCLDDLAWAIVHEISKMCYRVSEDDVTRACNQLKSSMLLHIDGTSAVAEDIGRQVQIVAFSHHVQQIVLSGSFDHLLVLKDERNPSHSGYRWSVDADVESLA